jgi:uncharacterized protein
MTLDEAFEALGTADPEIPVAAMQCLLADWEVAGPRCRALLHAYVNGLDFKEHTERSLFTIVHLLGEKRETATLADLCALAGDPERADLVLGDAVAETMPGILINCFDRDTAPLRALIERADADGYARVSALFAMAYLAKTGRVPAAEMDAYLVELFTTLQPQGEHFIWYGWVTTVGVLGLAGLADRAAKLFDRGFVPPDMMLLEHFWDDLKRARAAPNSLDAFDDLAIGPLDDAVALLANWGSEEEPPLDAPYINPLRGVGRNDPCPCGSGKKFKKCCMAA